MIFDLERMPVKATLSPFIQSVGSCSNSISTCSKLIEMWYIYFLILFQCQSHFTHFCTLNPFRSWSTKPNILFLHSELVETWPMGGAINNWLRKSPAAPCKSFTQTQQSEAQLNVVVKDGEKIGATILYSQKTPIEIRR